MLEDLVKGQNDWRNISHIVRATFKAFHDALKKHADSLHTLTKVVDDKASRDDVSSALRSSATEVCGRLNDVETRASELPDRLEVEEKIQALHERMERDTNKSLSRAVASKAEQADVWDLKDNVGGRFAVLQAELQTLRQELAEARAEAAAAQQRAAQAESSCEDLQRQVFRHAESIKGKADQWAVDRAQQACHTQLQDLCKATQADSCSLSALTDKVAAEASCWRNALAGKVSAAEVHGLLEGKASVAHVKEALAQKADRRAVRSLQDAQQESAAVAGRLALVEGELQRKAATQDVCRLLETKASSDELADAVRGLSRDLNERVHGEDLQKVVERQELVNKGFSSNMSLGRWVWKSGRCRAGKGIPWNVQTMNSDPGNFVWQKNKASIIVMECGIYELSFGVFAKAKPTVQVLVNGEPVLCAINNSAYVTHHTSGRLTTTGNLGVVTGLTALEFLSLPGNARVSLQCSSDANAEGFMSLKRM